MKSTNTPREFLPIWSLFRLTSIVLLGLYSCSSLAASAQAQALISTVAGTGTSGYNGDNRTATSAELWIPAGVAIDASGNIYIADYDNNRVRKVNSSGTITTVAGTGTAGYNGDNQPATSAELSYPLAVAVDGSGNLYIADFNNSRVRKVSTSGTITTVAGTGTSGYNGDNQAATSAELNYPGGVAVDKTGNIFVSDTMNNRIRKINTSGTITTVAGDGAGGFNGDNQAATSATVWTPYGITVDGSGNLFIADCNNNRARKVNTSGIITTVAGNGTAGYNGDNQLATAAEINQPYDVTVDASGNVYIADFNNSRIRMVNSIGTITTVAGNGTAGYNGDNQAATGAELYRPTAVVVDASGNIYIADAFNQRIRKVTNAPPVIATLSGTGTGGYNGDNRTAASAELWMPTSVAADASGNVYIADYENNRVRKVSSSGIITTIAGTGTAGYNGDNQLATAAELSYPMGVAVDGSGNVYIADFNNSRIRKVNSSGIITTIAGTGTAGYNGDNQPATSAKLEYPTCVALDNSGDVFIADCLNNRIRKVNSSGTITTVAGTGAGGYNGDNQPATSATIWTPYGVAVDGAGNLYIADCNNNRIRKVSASGTITTIAGNGTGGYNGDNQPAIIAEVYEPYSVALDGAGNLYIADFDNNRVRKINTIGIITTVAGNGTGGYNGDTQAAASAEVYKPTGVALNAAGTLFIADTFNQRVRTVTGL